LYYKKRQLKSIIKDLLLKKNLFFKNIFKPKDQFKKNIESELKKIWKNRDRN